jgi:tripartite-type tricarboxylate transporter receptor subunit TctC
MKNARIVSTVLMFFAMTVISAFAGTYPEKPIKLLIPYGGGGSTDVSSRMLAGFAKETLGQPINGINKVGGGGSVMLSLLKKSKPDGYTLGVATGGSMALVPSMRKVSYTAKDFSYIMQYSLGITGILVSGDSPYNSIKDIVEFARKNPGKLVYTTPGAGTFQHLAMEYLSRAENIKLTHLPSKSGSEGAVKILGKHVDILCDTAEWMPYVESGKMKVLALPMKNRISELPDVPTLYEMGYKDFFIYTAFMIVGPKDLPENIRTKLEKHFLDAAKNPDFKKVLDRLVMLPNSIPGQELEQVFLKTSDSVATMLKNIGMYKKE